MVRSVRFEECTDQKGAKQRRPQKTEDKPSSKCVIAEEVEQMIEMKLRQGRKNRKHQLKQQIAGTVLLKGGHC